LTGAEQKEFQALIYGDVDSKKSEAGDWKSIRIRFRLDEGSEQ
jgi:hypothetical protein